MEKLDKFMKYMPGLYMFVAGFMFLVMCQDFLEGNIGLAFISSILFLGNLCAYIHDVRKKENESLR
jgi:hypothetical protein